MELWEQQLRKSVENKQPLPWLVYVELPIAEVDAKCQRYLADKRWDQWWKVQVHREIDPNRPSIIEFLIVNMDKGLLATVRLSVIDDSQTEMDIQTAHVDDATAQICLATFVGNWLAEREWAPKWKGTKEISESESAQSENNPDDAAAESPRLEIQIKTTAVHYAHVTLGKKQDIAAQRLTTSGKSYRNYRDRGWLLTDEQFKRITEKTPAEYWKHVTGG